MGSSSIGMSLLVVREPVSSEKRMVIPANGAKDVEAMTVIVLRISAMTIPIENPIHTDGIRERKQCRIAPMR